MSFVVRIIIGFIIIFLLELYFYKKFVNSSERIFKNINRKKFRRVTKLVLIGVNIYPIILLILWAYSTITQQGRPSLPESYLFDYFILYPFWISVLIIIQTLIYFFILDIFKFLIYPIYRKVKEKIKPYEAKLILGIVIFFIVYVPARIIYDYNSVSLRIVEYSKPSLPDEFKNFKLIFISDIQADRYTDNVRLTRFISKVNSAEPDLVLIAGDIITSTDKYVGLAAEYLGKIESKNGVYSCVGDHDNWVYRWDNKLSINTVSTALKKYNIEMLNNEKKVIETVKGKIGVAFITNTYVESINVQELDKITNGNFDHDLKIFLTHQPREHLIRNALKNNYDLFLAGHTHGGQITFLFPFIYLSPTLFETPYVRGSFDFDNMLMVVTRGLGMSLVPIRYNSTPEVTLIVINPDNGS